LSSSGVPAAGRRSSHTSPSREWSARTAPRRSHSRNPETHGYEEAVLACFDTATTWNLHVDEKLRRDLPDGSARVKILGAPGAYEVDWWSPALVDDWEPVERGEFDDIEEPDEVSHLA